MIYCNPHYEDTFQEVPDTQEGEIRDWPDCEGEWKLASTGEVAIAREITDIEDRPMFIIKIGSEGPLFSIDMEGEKFIKL